MTMSGIYLCARICRFFPCKRTIQTANRLCYVTATCFPGRAWSSMSSSACQRHLARDRSQQPAGHNMNRTINTTSKLLFQTLEYGRRLTASIADRTALPDQHARPHDTSAWHTVLHHVTAVCHDITVTYDGGDHNKQERSSTGTP